MDDLRTRLDTLESQLQALQQHTHTVTRRLRWWRGLAGGLLGLAVLTWALPLGTAQEESVAGNEKEKQGLEERVAALERLLKHFSRKGNDVTLTGANLHIVNGLGSTDCGTEEEPIPGCPNGLGNLIVGYNELRELPPNGEDPNVRTGSHNVVVGQRHNFSRFGGLVVGDSHTISGDFAVVSGGLSNTASGDFASVSGGLSNTASGEAAAVSGGLSNFASGRSAAVITGNVNEASGDFAVVSGGQGNTASGFAAAVCGGGGGFEEGAGNTASGNRAVVSGGSGNTASGDNAVVSGGGLNPFTGEGQGNTASGLGAVVSGGHGNTADGEFATVSGGQNITQETDFGWSAGSEADDVVVGNFRSP